MYLRKKICEVTGRIESEVLFFNNREITERKFMDSAKHPVIVEKLSYKYKSLEINKPVKLERIIRESNAGDADVIWIIYDEFKNEIFRKVSIFKPEVEFVNLCGNIYHYSVNDGTEIIIGYDNNQKIEFIYFVKSKIDYSLDKLYNSRFKKKIYKYDEQNNIQIIYNTDLNPLVEYEYDTDNRLVKSIEYTGCGEYKSSSIHYKYDYVEISNEEALKYLNE